MEIALLGLSRIWGLENKKGEAASLPLFLRMIKKNYFFFPFAGAAGAAAGAAATTGPPSRVNTKGLPP